MTPESINIIRVILRMYVEFISKDLDFGVWLLEVRILAFPLTPSIIWEMFSDFSEPSLNVVGNNGISCLIQLLWELNEKNLLS